MRIAVAGATGTVGRHVLARAQRSGHEAVPLSRAAGVDLTQPPGPGTDLGRLLVGCDAVVDCLNVATNRTRVAQEFFTRTSRHLLEAGREAGVGHHVVLSIVGIEDVPLGYYRGKVAQEQAVRSSGHPHTILRATQFHAFPGQLLERFRVGPVVLAPAMTSAPVDEAEVAAALVELATSEPRGQTLEIGGPETLQMVDLVRRLARARGVRARVVPLRVPGAGRALRSGALVPEAPWRTGRTTWDEWLAGEAD